MISRIFCTIIPFFRALYNHGSSQNSSRRFFFCYAKAVKNFYDTCQTLRKIGSKPLQIDGMLDVFEKARVSFWRIKACIVWTQHNAQKKLVFNFLNRKIHPWEKVYSGKILLS